MGSEAPGPTYWETPAPPSSVLGIGENISAKTVYPGYILGSALVPISWGMHVAAWIQKQNGK